MTVIIVTSASLYTFIDNAMANHANAITQRTVSGPSKDSSQSPERQHHQRSGQEEHHGDCGRKWPAVNTETTMSTSSQGALGR